MSTSTRGRPRDRQIDDAVLDAVLGLLEEEQVGDVAVGEVARRAGVSRPAVYRRWPDRFHLVVAALTRRAQTVDVPATGCTLCDVHEALALASHAYRSLGAGTLAQLLAESAGDPERRDLLTGALLTPVRSAVHRTLAAALERGDLRAGTDLDLSVDTLCALVFHRLLLGQRPLTGTDLETVVVGLLRGIAARPEALLAEYDLTPRGDRADHEAHHQDG